MASVSSPAITSAGIGSGLDVPSLVNAMISSERLPLTALQKKNTDDQAKISAYGTIKSNLSGFQTTLKKLSDPKSIQTLTSTVADSTVLTASTGRSATPGTYNVEVKQLAQAQKLAAAGQTDLNATIGSGVLTFDFGTMANNSFTSNGLGAKTVTIDADHQSLSGIRDAINAADIGVSATIVNDGSNSPYRLTLTNSQTGLTQSMSISVGPLTGSGSPDTNLSNLLTQTASTRSLTETVAPQNAVAVIDGISVSKSTNTLNDVISGVSLTLNKTNVGSPTTVSVARDTKTLTSNLNEFVSGYNKLTSSLKSLSSYDLTNKKGATLYGDSSLRSMLTKLRSIVSSSLPDGSSSLTRLSQVGIELQKDGTLSLNQTKLQTAIDNNFSQLANVFSASGTISDGYVNYATSTDNTQTGSYAVNISQLATQANITSQTTLTAPVTISSTNNSFSVNLNGLTADISLTAKTYGSLSELATEVQAKINGVKSFSDADSSVTVSVDSNKLKIQSTRYGSGSSLSITGSASSDLFNSTATANTGINAQGTINGATAVGSGQTLTGATGNAAEGLALKITGGAIGSRGNLNYTQGFAYQLNQSITSFLSDNGVIANRTDGISSAIKKRGDQITRLQDRLDMLQKQYTKQFNTLDQTMSKMNSTSSYLSKQLASL